MMQLADEDHGEAERLVYMETGLSEPRYWVPGHKRYQQEGQQAIPL